MTPINLRAAVFSYNASDHAELTGCIVDILPLKCFMLSLGSPCDSLIDIQQAVGGSTCHYYLPAQRPRYLQHTPLSLRP